jgi:hypothetical protein
VAFRQRVFWNNGLDYSVTAPNGQPQYPIFLFMVLGGTAENLQ